LASLTLHSPTQGLGGEKGEDMPVQATARNPSAFEGLDCLSAAETGE